MNYAHTRTATKQYSPTQPNTRAEIKLDTHYHFLVKSSYKRDYKNRVFVETWQAYDRDSAERELGLHAKEFELLCKTETQHRLQQLFQSQLRLLTYQYLFHFLLRKYPKFKNDPRQQHLLSLSFQRFPKDVHGRVKNTPLQFPFTLFNRQYPLPNVQKLLPPKSPIKRNRAHEYASSGPRVVRIRKTQKTRRSSTRQAVYN